MIFTDRYYAILFIFKNYLENKIKFHFFTNDFQLIMYKNKNFKTKYNNNQLSSNLQHFWAVNINLPA
jgi:hypothetical protein